MTLHHLSVINAVQMQKEGIASTWAIRMKEILNPEK